MMQQQGMQQPQGLMGQAAQQQQPQQQDMDGDAGDPNDAVEEKVVTAAADLLYDPSMQKKNIAFLQSSKPSVTIPKLTAQLIALVDEKSGDQVPEDVILPAAIEFYQEVQTFAGKQGITIDPNESDDALGVLVQELMQHYGVDQEQVQELINQPDIQQQLQQVSQGG